MLLRLHRRNADETGLGGVHSSPPPLSFRRIWARQIHVDQLPLSDRPVFPWISGSIPSDQADCAGKSRCSQTLGGPEWASVCPSLILRGVADWSPVEAVDSNQVTALCCCYWAERVCLLSLTDCRAAGAFLCFTAFSWWHLWLIWDPPQQSQLPLAENQTALLWMFSPWCHRWDYKQDLTAWLHLKGEVFERRQTWLFRWTLNVKRNRFWAPSVSPLQVKMQVFLLICSTLQMAQFHCSCPFWWTKGRFFRSRCDHIYPIPFPHYLFCVNHAHFRCHVMYDITAVRWRQRCRAEKLVEQPRCGSQTRKRQVIVSHYYTQICRHWGTWSGNALLCVSALIVLLNGNHLFGKQHNNPIIQCFVWP